VGALGSAVDSPRLGPIGLGLVRREAEPGATLSVVGHGASATVVELPFATQTPHTAEDQANLNDPGAVQ
jgi:hypothetical protein